MLARRELCRHQVIAVRAQAELGITTRDVSGQQLEAIRADAEG
jgi:hypothetical protein